MPGIQSEKTGTMEHLPSRSEPSSRESQICQINGCLLFYAFIPIKSCWRLKKAHTNWLPVLIFCFLKKGIRKDYNHSTAVSMNQVQTFSDFVTLHSRLKGVSNWWDILSCAYHLTMRYWSILTDYATRNTSKVGGIFSHRKIRMLFPMWCLSWQLKY